MRASTVWLLGVLGAALALLVYSRTQKGAAALASGVDAVVSSVRGMRNNNPGNVRESKGDSTAWVGERATDDDSAFEEFTEMKYGVRAAAVVFRNYQRLYGLHTIRGLVSRWAPPSENDTPAYIAAVAARTHINADTSIDLSNHEVMFDFLRAIFRHENGLPAEAIPDDTINQGIRIA
jgi:hypothetical protein